MNLDTPYSPLRRYPNGRIWYPPFFASAAYFRDPDRDLYNREQQAWEAGPFRTWKKAMAASDFDWRAAMAPRAAADRQESLW